jgi:hypothetical protein
MRSSVSAAQPGDLALDAILGVRPAVGVERVEQQADAPAEDREDGPEQATARRHEPDDRQHAVDEQVGVEVVAELGPLLEPFDREAAQLLVRTGGGADRVVRRDRVVGGHGPTSVTGTTSTVHQRRPEDQSPPTLAPARGLPGQRSTGS